MTLKRLLTVSALLIVLISSVAFATPAMAGAVEHQVSASPGAVGFCRDLDEAGQLDPVGLTFGECVNAVAGAPNSDRALAAVCGGYLEHSFQELTGTTNKGQCIKGLNELLEEEQ